jgi:hypothetical protein
MDRVTAVMLLGGLRHSALEADAGLRPACLPLDASTSLLGTWVALLARAGCEALRVITSGGTGDDDIDREIDTARARHPSMTITRAVEGSSHRGTGGLLRDAAGDLTLDDFLLYVEPHCAPPAALEPLVDAGRRAPMAVGVGANDAPAGSCLVKVELLEHAPRIGYHDFKEQFIPLMVTKGVRILPVPLDSTGLRVHDLRRYLASVSAHLGRGRRAPEASIHPGADVHPTARIDGGSIIAADAHVGAHAIVHDSVILPNAAVGERSVVARSLVPRGFRVAPRSLTVDRVLDKETSDAADEVLALGTPAGGSR